MVYYGVVDRRKYTREQIEAAVRQSSSIVGVLRCLGIRYRSGEAWRLVRSYVKEYALDTSHFKGYGQNKGKRSFFRKTPDQILTLDPTREYREDTRRLRRAMIEAGVPLKCVCCGQGSEWQGRPLVLAIDHANGDWHDNRRENVRFLCPNCHSQTETFSVPKRGARSLGEHQLDKLDQASSILAPRTNTPSVRTLRGSVLVPYQAPGV